MLTMRAVEENGFGRKVREWNRREMVERNIAARSRMRSAVKAVRSATTRPAAESAYRTASIVLDRTAAKGIIKRETASRQKSRLAKFATKLPA